MLLGARNPFRPSEAPVRLVPLKQFMRVSLSSPLPRRLPIVSERREQGGGLATNDLGVTPSRGRGLPDDLSYLQYLQGQHQQ
jgi:hypothetical protein